MRFPEREDPMIICSTALNRTLFPHCSVVRPLILCIHVRMMIIIIMLRSTTADIKDNSKNVVNLSVERIRSSAVQPNQVSKHGA